MKRKYKPQFAQASDYGGPTVLPTECPVAAYYRQSTLGQVGNISTSIQTIDLPVWLKDRGWAKDKIILIDTDEGVSGQLRIDQRTGMRYLYDLILTDQIKAVACQAEDRLFRDQTQIQVNIFIDACRKHQVLVLTPNMLYDFAHPTMGNFHIKQFRYRCEVAADYITTVVNGTMYAARQRLHMEGRWSGGITPLGYMVDMRKVLPDGTRNTDWRRYTPFEPFATVTVEYFKLFLANGCNIRATVRQIKETGPWYPETPPPEGYKVSHRLKNTGSITVPPEAVCKTC